MGELCSLLLGCKHGIDSCTKEMQERCRYARTKEQKTGDATDENKYLTVNIPGTDMFAQAHLADEGLILDIFKKTDEEGGVDCVIGTYAFYDEMGVEINYIEEDDEE